MAKHIFRREDEERTELLGHDELFVQKGKGSDTYYNAWLHDSEIECCPRCGSDAVKTQDLFSKTYLDLVSDGQRKKVIQLEYEFYKYRCLDKDCRHVFSKPVGFASKRDNVTFRLENEFHNKYLTEPAMRRLQTGYPDQFPGRLLARFSIDGYEKKKLAAKRQCFLLDWRFCPEKRIRISIQYFLTLIMVSGSMTLFMASVLLILRQYF